MIYQEMYNVGIENEKPRTYGLALQELSANLQNFFNDEELKAKKAIKTEKSKYRKV